MIYALKGPEVIGILTLTRDRIMSLISLSALRLTESIGIGHACYPQKFRNGRINLGVTKFRVRG